MVALTASQCDEWLFAEGAGRATGAATGTAPGAVV